MIPTVDDDAASDPRADLEVPVLGPGRFESPMAGLLGDRQTSAHYVNADDRVLVDDTLAMAAARGVAVADLPAFEAGGPRRRIYFDPARTRVGIVTCGGLCPGLNDVIRGLVLELARQYGVERSTASATAIRDLRRRIRAGSPHSQLGQPHPRAGRNDPRHLARRAGSGSDRRPARRRWASTCCSSSAATAACAARSGIVDAATARGVELAVIGVPKTIDNDIPFLDHSFGFQTAFSMAKDAIRAAYIEATAVPDGVGLVKLMGRHSGFIACYAALANNDADFVLIPEVSFRLEGPAGCWPASASGSRAGPRGRRRRRGRRAAPAAARRRPAPTRRATPGCTTSASCCASASPTTSRRPARR